MFPFCVSTESDVDGLLESGLLLIWTFRPPLSRGVEPRMLTKLLPLAAGFSTFFDTKEDISASDFAVLVKTGKGSLVVVGSFLPIGVGNDGVLSIPTTEDEWWWAGVERVGISGGKNGIFSYSIWADFELLESNELFVVTVTIGETSEQPGEVSLARLRTTAASTAFFNFTRGFCSLASNWDVSISLPLGSESVELDSVWNASKTIKIGSLCMSYSSNLYTSYWW